MRNLHIIIVILAAFLCSQNSLSAGPKSDKCVPKWVSHNLPEPRSGSYIFVRAHGTASTLEGAKQLAFVSMAQRLEIERGLTVNTNVRTSERFHQSQKDTGTEYEQEITLEVSEDGHKLEIVCREIDDYWVKVNGKYEVDVLYTVKDKRARGGSYDDNIKVTAKYPGAGFLSIVPSVGQFYKGSTVKGAVILGAEVAAIGAVVLCENTRSTYRAKMYEQPKYMKEYKARADNWETGRNVCIGAAAAIYVYNLIDAFAAPGAKHIVIKKGKANAMLVPYADSRSFGAGFAVNF